jgi:hypothetical protein
MAEIIGAFEVVGGLMVAIIVFAGVVSVFLD